MRRRSWWRTVSLRMRLAGGWPGANCNNAVLAIDWSCCSASVAVQTDGCACPTGCRKPLFQLSHSLLVRCWLFRVASNTFQVTRGNIGGMRHRRTCSPLDTDPVAAGCLIRRAVPLAYFNMYNCTQHAVYWQAVDLYTFLGSIVTAN